MTERRKITVNGEEFEVHIQFDNGKWDVSLDGKSYQVEMEHEPSRSHRKKRDSNRGGGPRSGLISSAIPGKIVSVLVSEGDIVEAGGVVVVLEAMKMQNEIKTSIDGMVEQIMCKPGERIEANVPLMEIADRKKEGE